MIHDVKNDSKQSQELVNSSAGSLNRVSAYQAKKADSRSSKPGAAKPGDGAKVKGCSNCGSKAHSSHVSDRRENCKAFHEACNGCGTVGHFKAFCKGGAKGDKSDKGKDANKRGRLVSPRCLRSRRLAVNLRRRPTSTH